MRNVKFFLFVFISWMVFCKTSTEVLDLRNGENHTLLLGVWELDYESTMQELFKNYANSSIDYQELYFIYLSKIKKDIPQANFIFEKAEETFIWKTNFNIKDRQYENKGTFEISLLERENQSLKVTLQDTINKETQILKIHFKDPNTIEVSYLTSDQERIMYKAIFKRVQKQDES